MINLLLGQPGGGKSYEAVVYHVLVALNRGRKVITNLPLVLEEIELICPGARELVEFRNVELIDGVVVRPFSKPEHYGDPWRHPVDGAGPLYIIDECHMALPMRGTLVEVEEWYAMHRHELADVLLITQSYGKISRSIRDLVQVVYRCKKATAFGTNDRYIRKVQDGLRGEVVNTSIRVYESKYFKLYKSHTRSGAGSELAAQDIKPIWSNWTFKGAAACLVLFVFLVANMENPIKPKIPPKALPAASVAAPAPVAAVPLQEPAKPQDPPKEQPPEESRQKPHPWDGYGLHIAAVMRGERDGKPVLRGLVRISQNGQPIATLPFSDLEQAGYTLHVQSDCVISLRYHDVDAGFVVCDSPKVSLAASVPGA